MNRPFWFVFCAGVAYNIIHNSQAKVSILMDLEEIYKIVGEGAEIRKTTSRAVSCDGGGTLGHPKVYYTISNKGFAECMYCDRVFVFDSSAS